MHRWLTGPLCRALACAGRWDEAKADGQKTRRHAYQIRDAWAEFRNSQASLFMLRRHQKIHEALKRDANR
jgi:hypothetical protein